MFPISICYTHATLPHSHFRYMCVFAEKPSRERSGIDAKERTKMESNCSKEPKFEYHNLQERRKNTKLLIDFLQRVPTTRTYNHLDLASFGVFALHSTDNLVRFLSILSPVESACYRLFSAAL